MDRLQIALNVVANVVPRRLVPRALRRSLYEQEVLNEGLGLLCLQHDDAGDEYDERVVDALHGVQRLYLDLAAAVAQRQMQVVYSELARVLLVVHDGAVLLLCDADTAAVVIVERVQLVGVLGEDLVVRRHELHCAGQSERVRRRRGGGWGRRRGRGRGSGGGVGVHLHTPRHPEME